MPQPSESHAATIDQTSDQQRKGTAAGRLLTLLHRRGRMTRAQLTTESGLARSAVGTALAELTDLGLIQTGQAARPSDTPMTRGRPSPEVFLRPDGPVVIAVQLWRGRFQAAVIGLGHVLERVHTPVRLDGPGPQEALDQVADLVIRLREQAGRACVGIAVATPGFVRDGRLLSSLHLAWTEVPLASLLARRIPDAPPILVGRSSGLAALAEFHYGAGAGAATLLGLNCEHLGIGAGLITGGGPAADAGHPLEAGHMIVDPSGRACPCGATGCLELYADGRGLLRAAGLAEQDALDGQDRVRALLAACAHGDPDATRAVRTTATHLATGISTLINILSPERIVLTGFLADLYRASADHIDREVTRTSIVARTGRTRIVTGTLAHPVLHGAAELAAGPLLGDPALARRL
ncbi:MAG TPA: ROK family protein [Actinocrinis sp.]|jgi:predicted NBD/HSP70 family sugar kinase